MSRKKSVEQEISEILRAQKEKNARLKAEKDKRVRSNDSRLKIDKHDIRSNKIPVSLEESKGGRTYDSFQQSHKDARSQDSMRTERLYDQEEANEEESTDATFQLGPENILPGGMLPWDLKTIWKRYRFDGE